VKDSTFVCVMFSHSFEVIAAEKDFDVRINCFPALAETLTDLLKCFLGMLRECFVN
jgi:hypothetical protein